MSVTLGFRTITKAFIHRYVYAGTPPVLTPRPVSLLVPPTNAEIDPGISLGEIKSRNCKGQMQTQYTYKEEVNPMLKLSFDLGTPELESLIHGQVVESGEDIVTPVLFEASADGTSVAGRTTGEHGYQVTAVSPSEAAAGKAMAYYIDPQTKLAKQLQIVASSPTGDQIVIGANLALTLSSALAGTGYKIYGRVNAVVPQATVMTAKEMGLVGVFMSGIYHDGTVREFRARYCSLNFGSSLSADGKREVNLRILPDTESISGLGWDLIDVPLQMAC